MYPLGAIRKRLIQKGNIIMELSVMSPVLAHMSLEEAVKYLSSLGVDSFEIGAGGYPGKLPLPRLRSKKESLL